MPLDPDIFKAYDIRGLYGSQIDGDTAELIGRAFARVLSGLQGKPTADLAIGLGHDMRLSSPELTGRYRDGLLSEGVHVLDAGEVATEVCYFLVGSHELDGGLIVTASHNPAAYTGAKLVGTGALALSGDTGIQDVRRLIEAGLPKAPGGGTVEQVAPLWHHWHKPSIHWYSGGHIGYAVRRDVRWFVDAAFIRSGVFHLGTVRVGA